MTQREIILNTLKFQPTEHIPFSILNGQMWICARNNLSAAQLLDLPDAGAQLLVDAYKEIGTSIMSAGCQAAWPMMTAMGGEIDMNGIAGEITTRPMNELSDIDNYDINEVIKTMREDHYYQRAMLQTKLMREIVGDEYMIAGGFFGPFTIAAQFMGVDNFMVELYDDEDGYAEKVLNFAKDICLANFEDLIENGADLLTIPEPVASGDLISPAMFDEIVLPINLKLKEEASKLCENFLVHICGSTAPLVKPLAENQFGVFSCDSIDLVQAQEDSAKRIALFGNLSPAGIIADKTADEVYEISKALCAQMKPYGGFILAPGCDLAPNIPLENLQAMAKAASES